MAVKELANALPVHCGRSRFLPGRPGKVPKAQALAPGRPLVPAGLGRQESSRWLHGSSPRLTLAEAGPSRSLRIWANGVQSWFPGKGESKLPTGGPQTTGTLKYCWPGRWVPVPPRCLHPQYMQGRWSGQGPPWSVKSLRICTPIRVVFSIPEHHSHLAPWGTGTFRIGKCLVQLLIATVDRNLLRTCLS